MKVTFPEKSRSTVDKLSGMIATFSPDAVYNHQTLVVQAYTSGANQEMTPEEMAHSVKYANIDPSL